MLRITQNYALQTLYGAPHKICKEEGKLLGRPLNRGLYTPDTRELYDAVAGTCFLCGAPADSDSFCSLTAAQMNTYMRRFQTPERFLMINDHMVSVPVEADKEEYSAGRAKSVPIAAFCPLTVVRASKQASSP